MLVHHDQNLQVFAPYDDNEIWHLHAIVHLGDNRFAVTTGDSRKCLDLFRIDRIGCVQLGRLASRGAWVPTTAMP